MLVSGSLTILSPASLLQLLCQEHRAVQIIAQRGTEQVHLTIAEGLIVSAECGDQHGAEVVYQWLCWECGSFRLTPLGRSPIPHDDEHELTVVGMWEELLLEGARRRDETGAHLPPLPQASPGVLEAILSHCPGLSGVVLVGADGRLLASAGLPDSLVHHASMLVSGLTLVSDGLGVEQQISWYLHTNHQLILSTWSDHTYLLAIPTPGVTLKEASDQLNQFRAMPTPV